MVVQVRLFATLREGRFKTKEIEVAEGSFISDMLGQLKISEKEAGILLVNGRNATMKDKLGSQDVVSIFPPLGGG
jgi:molybdopterin converting factor small subunit